MNINNWSTMKKVFAILLVLIMIAGIILTIFLVQRQQETRSRATKATVLTLTDTPQEVQKGEEVSLNVNLNPGSNQVKVITFVINFDDSVYTVDTDSFKINPAVGFLTILEGPVVSAGQIAVSINTGSDTTKVISCPETGACTPTVIGTLKLLVKDDAPDGENEVKFDETKTIVSSVQSNDKYDENVLSSTLPAKITIGGGGSDGDPVCRPNVATCSWDAVAGASSYNVKVTELLVVVKEGDVDAPATEMEFPSEPGGTYKCEVTSSNECGTSASSNGQSVCPQVTPSPSPSPSPSPTNPAKLTCNATCEVNSDCQSNYCLIAGDEVEGVCRNNACEEEAGCVCPRATAEPTEPPNVTEGPGPTEVVAVPTEVVTNVSPTPMPTLPPTGNPFVMGGVIGGFLFVLGGLALLIL